ncbi:c-type cytochrome [Alkalimarinus coralli]|uniref:c-type cytochrome n=1 Tax=Alkalimarinus coralli TaxID=2935863 RepID=UPI00202B73FF|nr:c-type cytochrome [Alkalimarinus coralli]
MKRLLVFALLIGLCGAGLVYMLKAERINAPEPVAITLDSPWRIEASETQGEESALAEGALLFEGCASCHMADGSGRSDGSVPRLAGQNEAVLVHKLQKLRGGRVNLPVMTPFARALSSDDIVKVARYISTLPTPEGGISSNRPYIKNCAACHGVNGEGNSELLAPKLCFQHKQYLNRRISEIKQNTRGDADQGMIAILNTLDKQALDRITQWLAAGTCNSHAQYSMQAHEPKMPESIYEE